MKIIGLLPIFALGLLIIFEFLLGTRNSLYNEPVLMFLLHAILIFSIGILVAAVSARAYLISGSLNILFLGVAALMSGVTLMAAQWAITSSFGSSLNANEAVTMANIGILLSSIFLFLSAVLSWVTLLKVHAASRKTLLLASYLALFILITVVVVGSASDLFPVFFVSGTGSTMIRELDLALAFIFLAISSVLFAWKYSRTRSTTLYWYSLGIILFTVGLIGTYYTVRIGDAINWAGRIGFYLMGVYFLIALLSRGPSSSKEVSISERWAEAFRNDPRQVADLFANMTSGFVYGKIVTDQNGEPMDIIILDMNPAYESIIGVKRESTIGKRATEVLPVIESEVSEWLAPYTRAAIDGESVTLERRSPTTGKWNRITVYSPHKGYFVSIVDDITERKKAEEALKESEEKYRGLFNNLQEAVSLFKYVLDDSGEVVDWRYLDVNEAARKAIGKPIEDIVGKTVTQVFGGDAMAIYVPLVQEMRAKNMPIMHESYFEPVDGYALNFFAPLNEEMFIVSALDITRIKKAEEELKRSNEELKHFAYISSHDLQEPLRMVTSYLGLLERRHGNELSGEAKEYMGFVVEGAMRMRGLINDLLSYTRVDSRAKPFAQVDMNGILALALENLSASIQASHATVIADELPTITADDTQMVQLFQNLISNAIKFHGDKAPEVQVSCKEGRIKYTFSIKDNGIGIPAQYREKIFEMFQRLHTRDEYEGTGIGLAIAKKIVERHGGRIWVESDGKNGSTFYFTIPKRRHSSSTPLPRPSRTEISST